MEAPSLSRVAYSCQNQFCNLQLKVEVTGTIITEPQLCTKTPFSNWILVYVCAAEGLWKRARIVVRDDIKPPSNTGYKSIITPLIGMLRCGILHGYVILYRALCVIIV